MRSALSQLTCMLAAILLQSVAHATTLVPFVNLAELAAASDAVVVAQHLHTSDTPNGRAVFLRSEFQVTRSVHGTLEPGALFSLYSFSHRTEAYISEVDGDFCLSKAGCT